MNIQKMINILNIISGVVTVISFLTTRSGIVSFLLFIFTLLLNYLKKIIDNEEKIKLIIRETFLDSSENLPVNKYFIRVSALYAIVEMLFCVLGRSVCALFLFMVVMPICYSLLVLGILAINEYPTNKYGMIQCFVTPIPYYMVILFVLLDHNGFLFELGTVIISIIFYIPVFFVSLYVKNKIAIS